MGLRDLHINALRFDLHVKPSLLEFGFRYCISCIYTCQKTNPLCLKGVWDFLYCQIQDQLYTFYSTMICFSSKLDFHVWSNFKTSVNFNLIAALFDCSLIDKEVLQQLAEHVCVLCLADCYARSLSWNSCPRDLWHHLPWQVLWYWVCDQVFLYLDILNLVEVIF